ncbi:rho family-interacting cell polarization regulator 1-like, partial [Plectropomus leopardus]|uniref:rho family-interacting cell polarization regulator 1-like n=1 Tax=Plectropomus leopardus TaxID=160734 RepID=UPI001C4CC833
MTKPDTEDEDAVKQSPTAAADGVLTNSHASRSYSRSLSHISESSADGIVLTDRSAEAGEVMSLASGLSINDIEMEMSVRTPEPSSSAPTDTELSARLGVVDENTAADAVTHQHQNTSSSVPTSSSRRTEGADPNTPSQMNSQPECSTLPESADVMYVARRVSVEEELPGAGAECPSRQGDGPVDSGLEDALAALVSSLDDYRGQFPELQLLEQELKLLQVTLKGGRHSRSPSVVSLTVETALGSFDFLNASDWEEDEEEKADKRSRNG